MISLIVSIVLQIQQSSRVSKLIRELENSSSDHARMMSWQEETTGSTSNLIQRLIHLVATKQLEGDAIQFLDSIPYPIGSQVDLVEDEGFQAIWLSTISYTPAEVKSGRSFLAIIEGQTGNLVDYYYDEGGFSGISGARVDGGAFEQTVTWEYPNGSKVDFQISKDGIERLARKPIE